MEKGIIVRIVSNQYQVLVKDEIVKASAMGKLRLGASPIVGDHVMCEYLENRWVIQEVLPRRNQLIRPRVSNVDQALIVMSASEPEFSYMLVDRLLFLVEYENIEPIIVITKVDLVDESKVKEIISAYEPYGYKVVISSKESDTDKFKAIFKDKISVLAGQSGVGKSTLLNKIEPNFKLETQAISKALGRGKHTTRHNQLYELYGGWIADTPGFSSLDFSHIDPIELSQRLTEFKPFIGECKYRNCLHDKEPSCKIKEEVEKKNISKMRYNHYIDCLNMIQGGK